MRYSHALIPTLKEDPQDAQVTSHRLMMRAGMIRKVAAGVYTYLPLGWRVVQKVAQIVREEMNHVDSQEIMMPVVQPAELWQETGRWEDFGPLMFRLKDNKDTDFCLGPTHEEVITALVRDNVRSYRQLPMSLYQLQTKFRDEMRPRFGLMRAREFIMKDAYSFGLTEEDAIAAYEDMRRAYERIFTRCGLLFKMVEADTGSIGGNRSHEFQVLADNGEDVIVSCSSCGYAANVELAKTRHIERVAKAFGEAIKEVKTPGKKSIEDVSAFLQVEPENTIKALMFWADDKPIMVLCKGNHQVNEIKLKKALNANQVNLMTDAHIAGLGFPVGFVGPISNPHKIRVVADFALQGCTDMVAGASKVDMHVKNVCEGRDFTAEFFDVRNATGGDLCANCGGVFEMHRGIEVGHIFYLGTKYSKAMSATVQSETGDERVIEMGCYGIGVSRTAAAAIEQNHDDKGIIWPMPIAPYHVSLLRLGDDEELTRVTDGLYEELSASGIEILYDDRCERPGVKLNDSDLIGCPIRVAIGARSLKEGVVEVIERRNLSVGPQKIPLADAASFVASLVKNALER